MRRFRAAIVHATAVVGIIAAPAALLAQFPSDVQAGARVRVWLPESYHQREGPYRRQLLRGTVESLSNDTLHLAIPGAVGPVAIPRSAMRGLQVSRGVSRAASMVERAVGGAVAGAILFGLMNDPRRTGGPHYDTDWEAAGVGAAWGAGFGALAGLVLPHEHWRRVRLSK